jgi:hypothetical protein
VNAFLWVLQIALALVFLTTAGLKLAQPRERLATQFGWAEDFSDGTVKLIGVLELLAVAGLILPGLTGIAPVLTPLAALGLVALTFGAATVHVRRREPAFVALNAVLLVLAAIVAWGRLGPEPL